MKTALLSRDDILSALDEVMDPEVPVLSVVELGIVRDIVIEDEGITVVITPTYSGCPAMRVIEEDILAALAARGVARARIQTVYAPAWTTDWLSDASRRKLEAYGIAPPGMVSNDPVVSITRRSTAPRSCCPFCHSLDTEVRSEFGSTACKSICYCRACEQPFEMFKAF